MKKAWRIFFTVIILTASMLFNTGISVYEAAGTNYEGAHFKASYVHSVLNTDNRFPIDSANVVIQTTDGYMWFGGYDGLLRYDGTDFRIWNTITDDDFPSSSIRDLYEGKNGDLWIATNDKGLVLYREASFTVFDKNKGLPSNCVRSVGEDSDGNIYGGTSEGLFRLTPEGEVTQIPFEKSKEPKPYIKDITVDKNGNVLGVLNGGELFIYYPKDNDVAFIKNDMYNTIQALSNGDIAAGTQGQIVSIIRLEGKNISQKYYGINEKSVDAIYEDHDGRIWIACGTGIDYFTSDYTYHNFGIAPLNGFFSSVTQDYEGNYWFAATEGGIFKMTKSAFINENEAHSVPSVTTNAITKYGGLTYISTNQGLYIYEPNHGIMYENSLTKYMDGVRIRSAFLDSNNYIWFSTYTDHGLVRYDTSTDTYKSFLINDGLPSEKTRCVLELRDGTIAVGTANGLVFIRDDRVMPAAKVYGFDTRIQTPNIMILCMVEGADGTLYAGTDGGGIIVINSEGISAIKEENGLDGGVILRMTYDEEIDGVWVSDNGGICLIDKDKVIKKFEKMPPYSVLDILLIEDKIWVLTSSKILIMDKKLLLSGDTGYIVNTFDKSDGLTSAIVANSWSYVAPDENKLYFCCDDGYKTIALNKESDFKSPKIAVNGMDADGVLYENYDNKIVLPSGTNRITFTVALLSYSFETNSTVHYMLEGQDESDNQLNTTLGLSHEISYTNLKGGSYKFVIRAVDEAGNVSNEVTVRLSKELTFLEMPTVRIVLVLIILLAIAIFTWIMVRMKSHALLKKQADYKKIISEAISAMSNAIDAKDPYTSGHSVRVAAYAAAIARKMGFDSDDLESIYYTGLLHDVGKIAIPRSIITKPSRLTDEEYEIMKKHPSVGGEILKDITSIKNVRLGVSQHHEKWDGGGYTGGLSGTEISIEGRIICAADSYDAMASDRLYRKALGKEEILNEFISCKGTQFDPEIADIVIEMIRNDEFVNIDTADAAKLLN